MPIVISEKDRKFIERLGRHRILSENEINELMERCEREVRKKFNKDPYILIKNPGFLIKTYNEIFQSEKILLTNFKVVWNPYDNPPSDDPVAGIPYRL